MTQIQIIERTLINFIMFEKQTMCFYTEEDAKEYLKLYLSTLKETQP